MTIKEIEKIKLTPGLAYVIGLSYPLIKIKKTENTEYIVGAINHNNISQDDLANHFKILNNISKNIDSKNIILRANKGISSKLGFSFLIETDNLSKFDCEKILSKKVQEIKDSSDCEIKKDFMRGCFDGRASWDKTFHYLSIDVDKNHDKQNLIKEIFNSFGIEINLNQRELNYGKNDQIRIKANCVRKFITDIGLYSVCRKNIIEKGLSEI